MGNEQPGGADQHLGIWDEEESFITLHAGCKEPLSKSSKSTRKHCGYGTEASH